MTDTEQPKKKTVRAPERYREDGTYYTGPKDPKTYYTNYYHTKGAQEEECVYCNRKTKKSYMYKHLQTRTCQDARRQLLELMDESVQTEQDLESILIQEIINELT